MSPRTAMQLTQEQQTKKETIEKALEALQALTLYFPELPGKWDTTDEAIYHLHRELWNDLDHLEGDE
jgi:hypothetical protein